VPFRTVKKILFQGIYTGSEDRSRARHLYALDLATHKVRVLGPGLKFQVQQPVLAVSTDGRSALAFVGQGDVRELVKVPRDGGKDYQVLLSLPETALPYYLDAGRDGSIYVDAVIRPMSILRFPPAGGTLEAIPAPTIGTLLFLAPLADGRFLFNAFSAGKERVLIGQSGAEAQPLLQTGEEGTFPFAATTKDQVALRIGSEGRRRIALASLRDGRILRRLAIDAGSVESLAASPDGTVLYDTSEGALWSLPVDGDAPPRRMAEGSSVAIDPAGRFLYVIQTNRSPIALARVPAGGGPAEPIAIPDNIHLTSDVLMATAVDAQGRILVESASADSWFWRPAILDPTRRTGTVVNIPYDGDTWTPAWTADGRILAVGGRFSSTIWRYSPSSSAKDLTRNNSYGDWGLGMIV
jgi:hypothetical protein